MTFIQMSTSSIFNYPVRWFSKVMVSTILLLVAVAVHGKETTMPHPSATLTPFGTLEDKTPIFKATLVNANGLQVDVINYGGIITRIETPDKNGKLDNIVLGMDTVADYEKYNPYFGAIIGRYGNRIAGGEFSLDGVRYQLAKNDGDNHLHGGVKGFDKNVWKMTPFVTAHSAGVTLKLVSPDGDQGYPGTLDTTVTYTLTNDNTLDMYFVATTDKPTIVNLTQHSYFNLAGKGTIDQHILKIPATTFTPIDSALIPTGEKQSVAGTPFDFTTPKAIGSDIDTDNEQLRRAKGYDHNFILKDTADNTLISAAEVLEPNSGRILRVLTEEPAVQFYSGNFLDGSTQQNGNEHPFRSGFCLEPQHYPNSPNTRAFPSTTLMPHEVYSTRIVYEFDTQ